MIETLASIGAIGRLADGIEPVFGQPAADVLESLAMERRNPEPGWFSFNRRYGQIPFPVRLSDGATSTDTFSKREACSKYTDYGR
jgi:hypothetical protein